MDYFILFFAVLCIAVQFGVNKIYQKNFARGLKDMIFFPLTCGVVNAVFFTLLSFILYGKPPEFSAFSCVMSAVLAVVGTLSALAGILVMKYGKMSVYSVFMMLGGMILPYFYGLIFLNETISAARIAGLIILICALPFSAAGPQEKNSGAKKTPLKFYYALCVLIFLLNGTTSIISKTHSINISAVPAANFIVYVNLWSSAVNGAAYFILSRRMKSIKNPADSQGLQDIKDAGRTESTESESKRFRAVLTVIVYAVVSGAGFLFQLIPAKTVPAVALYPIVTGGSIVLSAVLARIFFKEKVGAPAFAGIIMSLCGTSLFLIR